MYNLRLVHYVTRVTQFVTWRAGVALSFITLPLHAAPRGNYKNLKFNNQNIVPEPDAGYQFIMVWNIKYVFRKYYPKTAQTSLTVISH
jgi:hypothetical protein